MAVVFAAATLWASESELTGNFIKAKANIASFSTITFGPEGILFVGDSKSAKVFALDVDDKSPNNAKEAFNLADAEAKIAAFLGTTADNVIIHDVAANPISQNIYLAVSRANAKEVGFWKLPNDVAYANILLKIDWEKNISEVSLENISHSSAVLPNPKAEGEKNWRGSDNRTETITDMAYHKGKLYVAGISNEEFASTLRVMPFPFKGDVSASTIEIWHAAHGKYETQSPIRTLLPFEINNQDQLLAAYTCTPLVSIPVAQLQNGKHVKSKTLAELGAGNIPLDIISYRSEGKERILIANASRSLMRIEPADLEKQKEGLTIDVDDRNTAGVPYVPLSGVGILQIDNLTSMKTMSWYYNVCQMDHSI